MLHLYGRYLFYKNHYLFSLCYFNLLYWIEIFASRYVIWNIKKGGEDDLI